MSNHGKRSVARKYGKKVLDILAKAGSALLSGFTLVRAAIWKIFGRVGSYIQKSRASLLGLLLWLSLAALTTFLILPSSQRFEGNVAAEELSFVVAQADNQTLLREISAIQQLTIEGKQSITLSGSFESKLHPELKQLDHLEFSLNTEQSQWSISPISSSTSELDLLDLRLSQGTTVNHLRYLASEANKQKTYKVALQLETSTSNNQKDRNFIQLALGASPLKLTVSGDFQVKSPKFKQQLDNSQPLEILFSPRIKDFKLPIQNTTYISLKLPKPNKDDPTQWIGRSLQVKNVQFFRLNESGADPRDNFSESTILQGQVRIAEKELKIQQKQFLTWQPETPGILSISGLQVAFPEKTGDDGEKKTKKESESEPSPKGIEVRFSGETSRIEVGLDKNFPIARLQAGWLNGRLPNEAVTVIISSIAAVVTSLIPSLINSFSKEKKDSQTLKN